MTQTEDVLAEYVERLFAKASLLSLAVLGHGRLLEDGCTRPDGNRLDQLQSLKFTFAKGAKPDAVEQMSTRLVGLAKAMDTTDGDADPK